VTDFRKKNTRILYFMELLPVGAHLLHADGRTDKESRRI